MGPSGAFRLTLAQRRYVAAETGISVAINAVISIAIAWLAFGGSARILTAALIRDALPQSFMVALMGGLVPTLLTRLRRRAGVVAGTGRPVPMLLKSVPVRIVLVAVIAAAVGVALHAVALPLLAPQGLSFGVAIVFKSLYGAMLAAFVTPVMLHFALADPAD
ncbi:hypothetical protein U1872_21780 [Sphingomonas sp. RB3P16]|uniref:hypothetical protein n=1 Tax=Parasphingomonas frigoris TaxID=3096163 RepID=UPI002FC641CB